MSNRRAEITSQYLEFLDRHIADVMNGNAPAFLELNQIATELFVSHTHLTDTVQKETGNHPCYFYDLKIVDIAKGMLTGTDKSIADIARVLTYEPSNFSKFFKKFTGQTPGQFRAASEKSGKFTTK